MIRESLCSFEVSKLAREKGFDEPCMAFWEWYAWSQPFEPIAYEPPTIDFTKLTPTQKELLHTRPGMLNEGYQPYQNSKGKPWLYARPTHDLLEEWLRVKHGMSIVVYIYIDGTWQWLIQKIGAKREHSVLPEYISGKPGSSPTHAKALDAACLHALNLLPDATRNTEEMPIEGLQDRNPSSKESETTDQQGT